MVWLSLQRAWARCVFPAVLAVALASSTLLPAAAAAQGQRVAVEGFRGPRASRVRSLLVANLEQNGYTVVGERELERAQRELGVGSRPSEDEYVQLGRELNVAAFVSGTVSRARRSWRLTVRVRNAADGQVLGSEGWGGRTTGAMDAIGRNGAARLREHLDRARAPGGHPVPVTAAVAPRATDPELPPTGDGIDPEEVAPPSDSSSRYDSFRLSVSAGSLWRSMNTTATVYAVRRGQPAADPATELLDETRGYTSSGIGHAELGVESELYPGALGDQVFPWLGVLVSFRHSAFARSYGCRRTAPECSGDGRVSIGTDQLDVQAGLRGRYRFGDRRGDFELFLDAVWGMSTFSLDPAALEQIDYDAIIPPAEYQYLGLGGGFEVAPIPDALVVALRAHYRPGLQIGAKAREVWGVDTEPASGFLVGAELRHEATWLAEGAFAALRFEYFQFQTTYRGQVGCATPGACPDLPPDQQYMDDNLWEPWPVDASGNVVGGIRDAVTDHHVRWGLYLGYAFR